MLLIKGSFATLSITTFCIAYDSVSSAIMQNVMELLLLSHNFITQHKGLIYDSQHKRKNKLTYAVSSFINCFAECRVSFLFYYAECRYAECRYAECCCAE